MPIEFACEECGSVLQVPEGTSGKRSRCPSCRHEQEIPWVVSEGKQAVASDKLSIPCPKCQHHLVCSPDLLGTRGQCKKCQHIFTISTEPVASESTAPGLVFHCPKCRQLFEGREEMRGRKGKCHVCQAVFMIELEPAQAKAPPQPTLKPDKAAGTSHAPRPAPKNPPTPAADATRLPLPKKPAERNIEPDDDDDILIIEEPEPKPRVRNRDSASTSTPKPSQPQTGQSKTSQPKPKPKPAAAAGPIRFECGQCRGVMEVPGSTAGLETECPYCQTIQTIPAASTAVSSPQPVAASSYAANSYAGNPYSGNTYTGNPYTGNSYAPQAASPAAFDPLDGLDLSASNPYAAPTQWSAPAATTSYSSSRTQLSIGNVLQLGFESLFPSCFLYFIHLIIFAISSGIMYGMFLLGLMCLKGTGEVGVYVAIGAMILLAVCIGLLSAWFVGALSRMALDAVRKKPLNIGDALNPAGAFNSAILVAGGGMGIALLAYLPIIVHAWTGAFKGFELVMVGWFVLFLPIMALYGFGTSLALYAGADGEGSSESVQTSMSLMFGNFGTAFAVMFIAGMITGILALPTLGLAYILPMYTSAALYHLAKRNR